MLAIFAGHVARIQTKVGAFYPPALGVVAVVGSTTAQIQVADAIDALSLQAVVLAKLEGILADITGADFNVVGRCRLFNQISVVDCLFSTGCWRRLSCSGISGRNGRRRGLLRCFLCLGVGRLGDWHQRQRKERAAHHGNRVTDGEQTLNSFHVMLPDSL